MCDEMLVQTVDIWLELQKGGKVKIHLLTNDRFNSFPTRRRGARSRKRIGFTWMCALYLACPRVGVLPAYSVVRPSQRVICCDRCRLQSRSCGMTTGPGTSKQFGR